MSSHDVTEWVGINIAGMLALLAKLPYAPINEATASILKLVLLITLIGVNLYKIIEMREGIRRATTLKKRFPKKKKDD